MNKWIWIVVGGAVAVVLGAAGAMALSSLRGPELPVVRGQQCASGETVQWGSGALRCATREEAEWLTVCRGKAQRSRMGVYSCAGDFEPLSLPE